MQKTLKTIGDVRVSSVFQCNNKKRFFISKVPISRCTIMNAFCAIAQTLNIGQGVLDSSLLSRQPKDEETEGNRFF